MLIDVHAHFYSDRSPRADAAQRNASRLRAGDRIGIDFHVASILGSWGLRSPIYFPSPDDLTHANAALRDMKPAEEGDGIVLRCFNATAHAVQGTLRFGRPRSRAVRVRADEQEPVAVSLGNAGRTLTFTAAPHAWVTLVVHL